MHARIGTGVLSALLILILGCPPAMPGGSATGNGNGDGDTTVTDPDGTTADDGPTAADCAGIDLTGFWRETSADPSDPRAVQTFQTDGDLISTFLQPYVCDHRDGQDTMSETLDDFTATVDECVINGTISVCRSGCDPDAGDDRVCGVITVPFVALFDPRGVSLSDLVVRGSWVDEEVGTAGTISYERSPCAPKFAPDYGLTDNFEWVRSESGSGFQNVDFVVAGECDAATPFEAGVTGTVSSVTSPDASVSVIGVVVGNGNTIEFTIISNLATPNVLVGVGDSVDPTTALGEIFPCEGLHLEALTAAEASVHPDCVEEE